MAAVGVLSLKRSKRLAILLSQTPRLPRGDKNSRQQAEFENSDLLDYPIFPQCQPMVDKK